MDSESEGDEVDLGENYCKDSDKESDWEPDQEDLDTQSEKEDEDFNSPRPLKNENWVIIYNHKLFIDKICLSTI